MRRETDLRADMIVRLRGKPAEGPSRSDAEKLSSPDLQMPGDGESWPGDQIAITERMSASAIASPRNQVKRR